MLMNNKAWQRNLPVPFFSQRENTYVWYQVNQAGIRVKENGIVKPGLSMVWQSCNITSLCMILQYLGITNDSPDDIMKKVFEQYFPEWRQTANGIDNLLRGEKLKNVTMKLYGIPENKISVNKLKIDQCRAKIAAGYPVWFSFGPLSNTGDGHIAVLRGFTKEDDVIINDPWGDVPDPYGYLKTTGVKGHYYRTSNEVETRSWGLGTGDNCIIKASEFRKIIQEPLFQTMVISESRMWAFPGIHGLRTADDEEKVSAAMEAYFAREAWKHKPLIGDEIVKNGFPLCENAKCHDGIHVRGGENEAVYSMGPGRLVAARNTGDSEEREDNHYNFVLLRHWVPDEEANNSKSFYSLYMHLAPVSIRQRIRARFEMTTTDTTTIQQESQDWLDQVINHIMPKKAMAYIEYPISGNDTLSVPVYEKDTKTIIGSLKDRSLTYLCPVNYTLKRCIETIADNESEADLKSLYTKLNTNSTYIYRGKDGKNYYRIFTRIKKESDEEYSWLDGYVETHKIIPQPINVKEYVYYRRKLASLIQGKIVVFNDEDTDTSAVENSSLQKASWRTLLDEQVRSTFTCVTTEKNIKKQCTEIQEYYLDILNSVGKAPAGQTAKQAVWDSFTGKLMYMICALLSYPWNQVDSPFKISDIWLKTNIRELYFTLYKNVYNADAAESWDALLTQLSIYCPRNTDYHLEVTSKTPVGTFGKYNDKNEIHCEIFSEKELIGNNEQDGEISYKQIVFDSEEKVFNKKDTVKLFKDAGIFDETFFSRIDKDYISSGELCNFYREKQDVLRHLVIKKFNFLIEKEENWFQKIAQKALGYYERNKDNEEKLYRDNPEAFFNDRVIEDIGFQKSEEVWLYHPAQFPEWLNKKQGQL